MKTVNVSGLKNNPSEALRQAREAPVLVMNRDEPNALLVNLQATKTLDMPGVRKALATALFKEGELSLTRSAKLAEIPIADFITHLSRLGIPVINQTAAEVQEDLETLEDWLSEA